MCSVVTNLVTSLEFKPIYCATMPCHFGRTRNAYVAIRFILLSSTAESSATGGYVVVPERVGQSEAQVGGNVERTKEKPNLVTSSRFNQCNMSTHVNMNFVYHFYVLYFMFFNIFWCISSNFLLRENVFDLFFYVVIYCVGAEIATLMSLSDGLYPLFSVKWWKKRGLWRKKWNKRCLFPARVIDNVIKVLFPVFALNWRVNNYVSRLGKSKSRRSETTIIIMSFCGLWYYVNFLGNVNCLLWLKLFSHNKRRYSPLLQN